jgi:hypothetical protein
MKRNFLFDSPIVSAVGAGLLLWSSNLITYGQAPPAQGRFRFINATSSADGVLVSIDSAKLRPEAFASGESTGAIGILAGTHRISVSAPNARAAETVITVQQYSSVNVIAYDTTVQDPQTGKPIRTLQVLAHPGAPRASGKHFQLLYASSRPTTQLVVNGHPATLDALKDLKVDDAPNSTVKIEREGKVILTFSASEAGNFLVILFDQQDGSLKTAVLRDYT